MAESACSPFWYVLYYLLFKKFISAFYHVCVTDWQGRRNRRGGGQAPPSFAKCPFFGSKVPFSCVKNVIKIAFANLIIIGNICIYMLFPENFFISGKNIIYPENFLVLYPEKFFETSTLPSPTFPGKNFYMPFFIRKVPLKAWPPQLLEASYAPADWTVAVAQYSKFARQSTIYFLCVLVLCAQINMMFVMLL